MPRIISQGISPVVPSNHHKLSFTGAITGNWEWKGSGGQSVILEITNRNVLGTTFAVESVRRVYRDPGILRSLLGDTFEQTESINFIILPMFTALVQFSVFGPEPMFWHLRSSTQSDAHLVTINIHSTWRTGMPPNR